MVYTKASKEGRLPVRKDSPLMKETSVFDLAQLDLLSLAQELQTTIQSKRWVLFKGWSVERARLDAERQGWIIEQIRNLSIATEELARTKANLFLHEQMIQDLINGYYYEAEKRAIERANEIERIKKEHEDHLQRIDDQAESRALENERVRSEIKQMRANIRLTELQGELLSKVIREMDVDNINPSQAFLLVKALNPKGEQETDFHAKQEMLNEELEKMRVENEKLKQEARKEQAEADLFSLDAERARKDYDTGKS